MLQLASEFRHEPTLLTPGTNGNAAQPQPPPVSAPTLQHLTSIAQDFDELANTCLLLLHLEVSVKREQKLRLFTELF